MEYKIFFLLTIFWISSCNIDSPNTDPGKGVDMVGDPLTFYFPRYASRGKNQVMAYDPRSLRVHKFDLTAMSLTASIKLDTELESNLLSADSSDYVLDVTDRGVYIIQNDGTRSLSPLTLAGKPFTAAFDPNENTFAVTDDLNSIGLLKLEKNGTVIGSWVGGPIIEGALVRAGAMLSDNRLAVSTSDSKLLVIDVTASIERKSWSYEVIDLGDYTFNWLNGVPGQDNLIIATTPDNRIELFDITTNNVLQSRQLLETQQIAYRFRLNTPHIYVIGDVAELVYADADQALASLALISVSFQLSLVESILEVDQDRVTVIDGTNPSLNSFSKQTVYRLRLSDGLVLTSLTSENDVRTAITSDYIFYQYDSPLGFVERKDYSPIGGSSELKGFNLEYLR